MNVFIISIIITILFGTWIWYQLSQTIGQEQMRDWEDFKKENPHLFRQPKTEQSQTVSKIIGMSEEQKKST
jgi:membrane protein DedA with SNARE-associated domain